MLFSPVSIDLDDVKGVPILKECHLRTVVLYTLLGICLVGLLEQSAQAESDPAKTEITLDAILQGAALGTFPAARDTVAGLSEIEQSLLNRALDLHPSLKVVKVPEGQKIGRLIVTPLDVVLPGEVFPEWFNLLRIKTRASIVEEQLIVIPGEIFSRRRIEEARRLLLNPRVVSAVVIVPVEGSIPGEVDLLVVTRDVWSLRLNSTFQFTGERFDFLYLSMGEENFLGLQKKANFAFLLEPDVWSIGPVYRDDLFFGSRHRLSLKTFGSFNRESGEFEGMWGSLEVGLPLYSLDSRWGWSFETGFRDLISRRFLGGEQLRFPFDASEGEETFPWAWRNRRVDGLLLGTRAFGISLRHEFSGGWGGLYQDAAPEDPAQYDAEIVARFTEEVLPRQEQWSYPVLRYRLWVPRYRTYSNMETFGVGEDLQMGGDFSIETSAAAAWTGSQRSFVGLKSGGRYRLSLEGADLFSLEINGGGRREGVGWRALWTSSRLRYVTWPLLSFARVHLSGVLETRRRDPDNVLFSLGGDKGLRGYVSGGLLGETLVRFNAEMRSLPWYVWRVPVGFVAFWDGGDAFEEFDELRLYQSVGAGVRWVFPQFNRQVYRFDWAFPLQRRWAWPGRVSFGFEQVF